TTSPRLPRLTTFSSRITCMTIGPGLFVVIGVRQQGQEAGALDGAVQLTLVVRFGTCQAGGNDLSVFLNEITQRVEILVIDLFNIGGCETAELATFEQRILLREFAFFLAFFEVSHNVPLVCPGHARTVNSLCLVFRMPKLWICLDSC